MRGTLEVSPRLPPVDFFENLRRSRSLTSRRKNPKKIREDENGIVLELTKFCRRISNRFGFLKHSENLWKFFWGWPGSPVPSLKNLVKIQRVEIDSVLKATEFRCCIRNRFWYIWLQRFWEFPLFPKLVKLIFPKNKRQKSRFRLD